MGPIESRRVVARRWALILVASLLGAADFITGGVLLLGAPVTGWPVGLVLIGNFLYIAGLFVAR